MSESLELTVSCKLNGQELTSLGFPLNRRITVDEVQLFGPTEEADDGNDTTFSQVPVDQVASVKAFIWQAVDQAMGLRVEGGEATNVALRYDAGGIHISFGATITATNITVNNNSGSTAKQRGLAGGT
jgi:hypothetical protein